MCKERGRQHIVLISAFGVNHNEQAPLRVVEHLVIDSGVAYTILRPNFFMENFSEGSLSGSIKGQNGIFVAAADSKTSFISVRDIAASVVAAFQTPLAGREFDLTGAEALDHAEIAKVIGEASGCPVAYHSLTEEQMTAGARAAGMPEPMVGYLSVLYGVVRAGYAAAITSDVEILTGRKPISFRTFADRRRHGTAAPPNHQHRRFSGRNQGEQNETISDIPNVPHPGMHGPLFADRPVEHRGQAGLDADHGERGRWGRENAGGWLCV